jgi:hypothetical protein
VSERLTTPSAVAEFDKLEFLILTVDK